MSTRVLRRSGAAAVLALAAAAPAVQAQQDSLRQAYRVAAPGALPRPEAIAERAARAAPGSTVASPSGFGASWGQIFAGAGMQARTRGAAAGRDGVDGTGVVGVGLGDARRLVGLEVAVTSLGTVESFGRFAVSGKLHRRLPADASVAVGWENAIEGEGADGGSSVFAVASKVFTLPAGQAGLLRGVTLTLGAGNGRFLPEADFLAGEDGVNVFGGASLRVADALSVSGDWTGQDLAVGVSAAPVASLPLAISAAVADLTGRAGTGARLLVGIGFGLDLASFRSPTSSR